MLRTLSTSLLISISSLLLIAPLTSLGQSTQQADLYGLVQQLQTQIRALQEHIASLQAQLKATKEEVAEVKAELKITRSLQRGATGNEVKQLQEFLKQFPDIYPEGFVTGYFGSLTEAAVKKLQERQGIEAIGIVGPRTLTRINELLSQGAGASGVIPPGLLTAPGIEKKLGVATSTPPAPTSTPPTATSTIPTLTSTSTTATTTTIIYVSPPYPPTTAISSQITTTASPTAPSSLYGSALNLSNVSDLFGKIWGPGSNGIIIGSGLNFSTKVGIGWSQQYGGLFVTSYSIQGVGTHYLTQTNSVSVKVTGPAGSIIEVWDLETLTVVAKNVDNPGSAVIFTAQPNRRYGGFAWYADNSQKDMTISASYFAGDTTPPSAPANLVATVPSATQVNLFWTGSTDNVGIAGYNIHRYGILFLSVATTTAAAASGGQTVYYPVTNLSPSTAYTFVVAAYDAAGNVSVVSNQVSATTLATATTTTATATTTTDTIAPSTPTGLYTASLLDSSGVTLYWNSSTDNVGVAGYKVYQNGVSLINAFSSSINLAAGYSYSVAAYDAAGNLSPQSSPVSATAQGSGSTSVPAAPSGLDVGGSSPTSISLYWADNSNNESEFRIERRLNGGSWSQVGSVVGNATTKATTNVNTFYTDNNLSGAGTYDYRVKACNSAGCSAESNITSRTIDAAAPSAPSGLTASVGTTSVTLGWTDNSTGESGFRLKRRVQGNTSWFGLASVFNNSTGNSVSFTDSYQLVPGTIYEYVVRSYNTYESADSNMVTVNFGGASSIDSSPPSTPTGVTATAVSPSQINLSWNASTDNVGVTAYQVFRNGIFWYQTASLSFSDTGLSSNTSYSYYVRALDAASYTSSPSATVSATTLSGTVTCSGLTLTFQNNKTTYAVGETATYTYTCAPGGSTSYVEVQVVKPDGTATTYNSVSGNISTQTLGFGTSNLSAGNYTLRACFSAGCTSVTASLPFTIVDSTPSEPPASATSTSAIASTSGLASLLKSLESLVSALQKFQELLR